MVGGCCVSKLHPVDSCNQALRLGTSRKPVAPGSTELQLHHSQGNPHYFAHLSWSHMHWFWWELGVVGGRWYYGSLAFELARTPGPQLPAIYIQGHIACNSGRLIAVHHT